MAFVFFFFFIHLFFLSVLAQNISTTTPVPPLQWINLSNLLQGSTRPPPLRDAAMGYDDNSRSLIIFGGLSESGVPQSQTFLLNLDTLIWSIPSPPPNLSQNPSPRSAVICGGDFAASNRHGFVVIGGRGSDDIPLSDVWEYDFISQFWSQVIVTPGGPSPRWGASGGIDIRTSPIQDPIILGPNNSFYLAGGFDGTTTNSLSDVWRLNISGALSSNLATNASGSWDNFNTGNLSGRTYQAGTVIAQDIVVSGGCNLATSSIDANTSCATQNSFVLDVQDNPNPPILPGPCPAPRVGAVLAPNENPFSSAFTSQVFLLLGAFNSSLWQDNDGLAQGEVAILDTSTGTWARILPSGDPDGSGNVNFPTPRVGASVLSFGEALVGTSRNSSADTLVFGGQDANGTFLSELWLLRGYAGLVTSTNQSWTGFGNGQLQTGRNANGSGVRVTYMTECASPISTTASNPAASKPSASKPSASNSPGSSSPGSTSGSGSGSTNLVSSSLYNTSLLHKILAPLSLVIFLPSLLVIRWAKTTVEVELTPERRIFMVISVISAFGAYGVGVGGLVFAFTTISTTSTTQNLHLKTTHGIAGLALFLVLYGLVPFLYLASALFGYHVSGQSQFSKIAPHSIETNDKSDALPPQSSLSPSVHNTSPPSSPRTRTQSWDAFNALRPSTDEGVSSDSAPSATPQRGFEVLNRPNRSRKASGTWPKSDNNPGLSQPLPTTRTLGEIDWLLRRRAVHAVDELDYAITQAHNAQFAPSDFGSRTAEPLHLKQMVQYPKFFFMILHILVQVSIFGLSVITLMILWSKASRVLFAVFLMWLVLFYVVMIVLAWNYYPTTSLLTAFLQSLRGHDNIPPLKDNSGNRNTPQPNGEGPYTYHRPPYRLSSHADELSHAHAGPMSVENDGNDDDDVDEDTRQRVIEEEMERRDVSIVTVPRRKLWIANPS